MQDWLDEEPSVLHKLVEKMKKRKTQKQNGSVGKSLEPRKPAEEKKDSNINANSSKSKPEPKRKSFSESSQLTGLSPDAIFNEAQK